MIEVGVVMRLALPILFVFLTGCTSFSPLLIPADNGQTAFSQEAIHVFVKPITTHGIGSDDERQWNVEISAYFTAFEVALVNSTKKEVFFRPLKTYLQVEDNRRLSALDREGSVQYYKMGDDPSRFVWIFKSKKKEEKEIRMIRAAWLEGGSIQPDQQKKGVIFFKKVKQDHCRKVVLSLKGITVVETGEEKQFSFSFSCKTKG